MEAVKNDEQVKMGIQRRIHSGAELSTVQPVPSGCSRSNNNKTSSNTLREKEEVFDKTKYLNP